MKHIATKIGKQVYLEVLTQMILNQAGASDSITSSSLDFERRLSFSNGYDFKFGQNNYEETPVKLKLTRMLTTRGSQP